MPSGMGGVPHERGDLPVYVRNELIRRGRKIPARSLGMSRSASLPVGEPVAIPQKPIKARRVELTVGSASGEGVAVQRIKLGPDVRQVLISRSRALQIGHNNRQLNHFQYEFTQPRVSVDHMLRGHPGRQRAFARLVDNPHSMFANWLFRQHLSGAARPRGCVRFADTSGPQTVRVAARLDERGAIVVDRSQGVQLGNWNTQRNRFSYRVVKQELSVEPMLRSCPSLARSLAMTVRHPGNAAARRSFTGQLATAYSRPSVPFSDFRNQYRRAHGLAVTDGAGVQLGSGTREDRVAVNMRVMVLTGWAAARRTTSTHRNRTERTPVSARSSYRQSPAATPQSARPGAADRARRWSPQDRPTRGRGGRSGRFGP